MGCNCKVTKNILKLHKNYGHPTNVKISEKIIFKLKETLKTFLLVLVSIIIFPIILIVVCIMMFNGKTNININNILKKFKKK